MIKRMLFNRKVSTQLEYYDFVKVLQLNGNNCNIKVLSHIQDDYLKIAVYAFKDHLDLLTEDAYNKLCSNLKEIKNSVNKVFATFEAEENRYFKSFLGVLGLPRQSVVDISENAAVSKATIHRRISAIADSILSSINEALFPQMIIVKKHSDVSDNLVRSTLYDDSSSEPTYLEIATAQSYKSDSHKFARSTLSIIHNRGLRAAVGSFKHNSQALRNMYDKLLQNRYNLESIILDILYPLEASIKGKFELHCYLAYWQLSKFGSVKMSAEQIAEYHNVSISQIRRIQDKISKKVNEGLINMLGDGKAENEALFVTRVLHPVREANVITSLLTELGLEYPLFYKNDDEEFYYNEGALGQLFGICSLKTAATARLLLNSYSCEYTIKMLKEQYGIDEPDISSSALRQRKVRFLKQLKSKVERVPGKLCSITLK